MASILEMAADRGERKVRKPRKVKPSRNVELFLKAKFVSRAAVRYNGDWPVHLEHNGTIIEDVKTAAAYLKQVAA